MTSAAHNEELNPLTGPGTTNDIVSVNLNNPRDPPGASAEQHAETQQQKQGNPGSKQEDKDYAAELGMACNKCYNWFPLGIFAWASGFVLIACSIFDLIAKSISFIEFWLYFYLVIGALCILIIDMPIAMALKFDFVIKAQVSIFSWVKLFRRIWGRCILYTIMMITCGSFFANNPYSNAVQNMIFKI